MKEGDRVEIVQGGTRDAILRASLVGKRGIIFVEEGQYSSILEDYVKVFVDGENRVYTFPKTNVRVLDAIELLGEVVE